MTLRNALLALALAAVLIVVLLVTNRCTGRQLDAARAGRELAQDDAAGRALEVTGAKTLNTAQDAARAQAQTDREAAHDLDQQARQDPAARVPLPDSVRNRVRAGDERLCGKPGAVCR